MLGSSNVGVPCGGVSSLTGGDSSSSDWSRPSDWLTMPELVNGDQGFISVNSVYEHGSNFLAFTIFGGNYRVDIGDGNGPVDVNAGTQFEANLNFDDYNSSTLSTRGYRQALIVVTPQTGQTLTSASMSKVHSAALVNHTTQYLDIVFAGNGFTSISFNGSSPSMSLERIRFVGDCSLNTALFMCYNCRALCRLEISDSSSITTYQSALQGCSSMAGHPDLSMASAINISSLYYQSNGLARLAFNDLVNVTSATSVIRSCEKVESLALNGSDSIESLQTACYGAKNLQEFIMSSAVGVTNTTNAFGLCPALGKVLLPGITVSVSVASCKMSAQALDDLFDSLGTVGVSGVPVATITITGNWGVAGCTISKATNKGWQVATS